jgi:hypothetical protein
MGTEFSSWAKLPIFILFPQTQTSRGYTVCIDDPDKNNMCIRLLARSQI